MTGQLSWGHFCLSQCPYGKSLASLQGKKLILGAHKPKKNSLRHSKPLVDLGAGALGALSFAFMA